MIVYDVKDYADQEFGTIINERRVTFRLRYNGTTDRWSFDLSLDDEPVLYGRRIVTGVDLLAPFDFEIGILAAGGVSEFDEPDRFNLPSGRVIFYSTDVDDVEDIVASIS